MNRLKLKSVAVVLMFSACVYVTSCKGKQKETGNNVDTTVTTAPPTPAPVEIATDDALTTGVKDATKDYPGVNAAVNNGEVTLTGEIQRSKLQGLMQTLNSLKPKKINNQLTIK